MKTKICPFCLDEFADDADLAYHLVENHREGVLNGSRENLEQATLDVVYFVVEADEAELAGFVRGGSRGR